MKRITEEPLVFPIGDKDYTVPPVGVAVGWQLAEILANPEAHKEATSDRLFRMALGDAYDEMTADGASLHLVFRAGMAALAHFKILSDGGTSEDAMTAAEGIWESGIHPEALAAWAAANPSRIPAPRTAAAGASTASTSTTSTRTKGSTRSRTPARASRSPRSSSKPK